MSTKEPKQPSQEETKELEKKIQQYKVKFFSENRLVPPNDLSINIEFIPSPPVLIAHIIGNLVEENAIYFYEKITPLYQDLDKILIACAAVEKIDNVGLAILVDFFSRTKRMEKHFSLVDPNEIIQKKVKEAGLEGIIPMNFTKTDSSEIDGKEAEVHSKTSS